MANSNPGDGRFVNTSSSTSATVAPWSMHSPSLPPKSPTLASDAPGASFFANATKNGKSYHQRTPSATLLVPHPPLSWIDDMLDSPEAPARKIHHRRSASDTAAFLEFPDTSGSSKLQLHEEVFAYRNLALMHATSSSGGGGGGGGGGTPPTPTGTDFERLDEEQIISMFSGESEITLQRSLASRSAMGGSYEGLERTSKGCGASFPEVASSPSDSNSGNEMSMEDVKAGGLVKTEAEEVQSLSSAPPPPPLLGIKSSSKQPTASTHIDPSMDPKRAKRILANRQSAQRSRVRKLQYIAELERSVTALQTEVSALTPQVAYLDHQRIRLNVDNSSIKQRIGTLMQDQRFKEAHNEALTREVHRLRQLLQQQDELRSQLHQSYSGGSATDLESENKLFVVKSENVEPSSMLGEAGGSDPIEEEHEYTDEQSQ